MSEGPADRSGDAGLQVPAWMRKRWAQAIAVAGVLAALLSFVQGTEKALGYISAIMPNYLGHKLGLITPDPGEVFISQLLQNSFVTSDAIRRNLGEPIASTRGELEGDTGTRDLHLYQGKYGTVQLIKSGELLLGVVYMPRITSGFLIDFLDAEGIKIYANWGVYKSWSPYRSGFLRRDDRFYWMAYSRGWGNSDRAITVGFQFLRVVNCKDIISSGVSDFPSNGHAGCGLVDGETGEIPLRLAIIGRIYDRNFMAARREIDLPKRVALLATAADKFGSHFSREMAKRLNDGRRL